MSAIVRRGTAQSCGVERRAKMTVSNWPQADSERAQKIWSEYERDHDLSEKAGQTAGIEPATGAATGAADGAGFSFRGDVAPAATPLVLGDGRIVIPLSDGTLAVR